jgi:hypothetical protein
MRNDVLNSQTPLYRGLKFSKSTMQEYKDKHINNFKVVLDGFQSTSLSKYVAINFMMR